MMPGMLMPAVPVTAAVSAGASRKQLCTTALWVSFGVQGYDLHSFPLLIGPILVPASTPHT